MASPLSLSHGLLSWPHLGDSKAIRGKQGASQEESFTMVHPYLGALAQGGEPLLKPTDMARLFQ